MIFYFAAKCKGLRGAEALAGRLEDGLAIRRELRLDDPYLLSAISGQVPGGETMERCSWI